MNSFTPSSSTASRPAARSTLLWFNLLALAIGVAQLSEAGKNFLNPLTLIVVVWLVLNTIAIRLLPSLVARPTLCAILDTLALLIFATGLAATTGGVDSPLITLFLLPLTAAATMLGRVAYSITAVLAIAASCALGSVTPGMNIASPQFVVLLISTLAPAIIATTAIVLLVEQMQGAERRIQDLSSTDPLTGLMNRRAFDESLSREHRKVDRSGAPYSIVLVDVANIGQLNDVVNRDAGNQMIAAVGKAIARSIRATDIAARYDSDEFIVFLSDADPGRASVIAQRIRSNVYAGTISVGNRLLRANIHVGLASFPKERRDLRELLLLAQQRMDQDRELNKTSATA